MEEHALRVMVLNAEGQLTQVIEALIKKLGKKLLVDVRNSTLLELERLRTARFLVSSVLE